MKAAFYTKVTVEKAESVLSEIGLGVRAMLGGRLIQVGLTPEGQKHYILHHNTQLSQDIAGALSPEEGVHFLDMLQRIISHIR